MSGRERQPETTPPRYWRSLEELAEGEGEAFRQSVRREFTPGTEEWRDEPSRREFLQRMGASFALAGLTGCRIRQPEEKIIPYVEKPEHIIPGKPQFFATAMPTPGGALGLLVESHVGRPTRVEGNPHHPASLGATDAFAQASILDLYDPQRSQVVRFRGTISTWSSFVSEIQPRILAHRERDGAGLHILREPNSSPTLLRQLGTLAGQLPNLALYDMDTTGRSNVREGCRLAFGERLEPHYRLDGADVLFSLDADFLTEGPAHVRLAREFANRRRVPPSGRTTMNRLYVAESTPSLTGAAADHFLRLAPGRLAAVLGGLARRLGVEGGDDPLPRDEDQQISEWLDVLADDLQEGGERSLVIVGPAQPPEVQALGWAMNAHLGNMESTVALLAPVDEVPEQAPQGLADLAEAIRRGEVETLLILGGNPAYSAPADLDFIERLREVPFSVHHGLHFDETGRRSHWHVPATHFLEAWSDVRAEDGTASIVQPLIAPLYGGRSAHELVNLLLEQPDRSGYDTVRAFWREELGEEGFDRRWGQSVHDGVIEETAFEPRRRDLQPVPGTGGDEGRSTAGRESGLEVVFRLDPTLHDGRGAENGWLQELPKPFTKITWGNAALIGPRTAGRLGLENGDVVELSRDERTIRIPVRLLPGQPDEVLTLHLGNGRHSGELGIVGVDVSPLRTTDQMWRTTVSLRPTGQRAPLPTTQQHFLMENRHLVRAGTLAEFQAAPEHPGFVHVDHHQDADPPSIYPDWDYDGVQWGMAVNLSTCIGCNACVVACQSENNIPVVGPDQVANSRIMHWLRIDTYYAGEADEPQTYHQPVACMHCEIAPCEPVCPVVATSHSKDGLNEMTYNRCIGTRFCSNNCPYKVRRFNFLDYRTDQKELPVLKLQQNPDVTVRSRGVMEKCTYCVQRIRAAGIEAKIDERPLRDGDVVTACQSACPSRAIVFGNINDPESEVSREKAHPLNYGLLTELNTRPRTSYLAAVRNPHPRLEQRGRGGGEGA